MSTSTSSSVTVAEPAPDVESQKNENRVSYFSVVFKPDGVNNATINHRYNGEGTEESPYIVDFLPQDSYNPMQYPSWKKWTVTLLNAMAALAVTFVSSAFSASILEIVKQFNVDSEIAILGISLFVVGFAIGPLLWAPLSGK